MQFYYGRVGASKEITVIVFLTLFKRVFFKSYNLFLKNKDFVAVMHLSERDSVRYNIINLC